MTEKRDNCLSWDMYFMAVAKITAERSKDPSTQVGAVVVNPKLKNIISTGYNGFPRGIDNDDDFSWNRENEWIDSKYPYVAHAELNAIVSAHTDLTGYSLYVNFFPCNECTKIIIQSGIKEIFYLEDKYQEKDSFKAAKKMLDAVGITYDKLTNFELAITTN